PDTLLSIWPGDSVSGSRAVWVFSRAESCRSHTPGNSPGQALFWACHCWRKQLPLERRCPMQL
ncbi:hypothetical protein ACJ72_06974, partial [Emergomyces africanus]